MEWPSTSSTGAFICNTIYIIYLIVNTIYYIYK